MTKLSKLPKPNSNLGADLPRTHAPILCLDFDGVLHSYVSGWHGPRTISDSPVPGAIDWLRSLLTDAKGVCAMAPRYNMAPRYKDFDVQVFSSRSRYIGGRRAMRKWLGQQFEDHGYYRQLVELIKFPSKKPPAHLMIDDRAICFRGWFPNAATMLKFKPWRYDVMAEAGMSDDI